MEENKLNDGQDRDYEPARDIPEAIERRRQGWDFADARMGKGWETRYPYLAQWNAGHRIIGNGETYKVSLETICSLRESSSAYIAYVFHYAEIRHKANIYEAADVVIRDWMEQHGLDYTEKQKDKWKEDSDWKGHYRNLAEWVSRGKRFCLTVNIDLITGRAEFKVWHYHKPSNKETILLDEKMHNTTEEQVLERIDSGIRKWLLENGDNFPNED